MLQCRRSLVIGKTRAGEDSEELVRVAYALGSVSVLVFAFEVAVVSEMRVAGVGVVQG